jgi:hypothetical protein
MTSKSRITTSQKTGRTIFRTGLLLLVASFITPANADNVQQQQSYMTPQEQQTAAAQRAKYQTSDTQVITTAPGRLIVPPPPAGAVFQTGMTMRTGAGQKRTQLNYLCKQQTPREIFEYYERSLRNDGWKVKQWMGKGEVPRMVMGSKGGDTSVSVQFNMNAKTKGCRICLVISEPK